MCVDDDPELQVWVGALRGGVDLGVQLRGEVVAASQAEHVVMEGAGDVGVVK